MSHYLQNTNTILYSLQLHNITSYIQLASYITLGRCIFYPKTTVFGWVVVWYKFNSSHNVCIYLYVCHLKYFPVKVQLAARVKKAGFQQMNFSSKCKCKYKFYKKVKIKMINIIQLARPTKVRREIYKYDNRVEQVTNFKWRYCTFIPPQSPRGLGLGLQLEMRLMLTVILTPTLGGTKVQIVPPPYYLEIQLKLMMVMAIQTKYETTWK